MRVPRSCLWVLLVIVLVGLTPIIASAEVTFMNVSASLWYIDVSEPSEVCDGRVSAGVVVVPAQSEVTVAVMSTCFIASLHQNPLLVPLYSGRAVAGETVEIGSAEAFNSPSIDIEESEESEDLLTAGLVEELYLALPPKEEMAEIANLTGGAILNERLVLAEWLDHFNRQSRTDCVKWASGHIPFDGKWKTCIGHRTRWRCQSRKLVVYATSNTNVDLRATITDCAKTAGVAGALALFVTGEAAVPVFEAALQLCMVSKIGGGLLSINVKNEGGWTDWGAC